MKREDIKVGGVYVSQVDGAECHVKVVRMLGIRWEVKVVQAPFGAHTLLGKKKTLDNARQFKSKVVEGNGVALPQGTSVANQNANWHGGDNMVEDEKRSDPLVSKQSLGKRARGTGKGQSQSPTLNAQQDVSTVTSTGGTSTTETNSNGQKEGVVADNVVSGVLVTGNKTNPECEGYAPNLATGVCRCKSCRSKPHSERTRRPFGNAQTAGPTTSIVGKGRPPTIAPSAVLCETTKRKKLTDRTQESSSSSLGSADMGRTMEGEDSSDPLVSKQNLDPNRLGISLGEMGISDVRSVASASTLPVQSFLEGKQVMASVRPTVSAVTVGTSGKRSVLPDTPFGGSAGAPHLEVRAYAGTGKSTTVVQGLVKVKGGTPKITPSDEQSAVWEKLGIGKNDSVRVSAFSNAISNEMGQKIYDAGLNGKGVEATGIHKLGFAAVRAQFGYLPPNGYAVTDLVCKKLGGEFNTLKTQKGMLVKINAVADLVSLCKQTMTAPTEQGLEQLAYRYDVEFDDQRSSVFQLVPDVLEACKKPQGKISFDDMIWLPVVLGLHIPKVDHQIIDESQDLNRMQQELMYLAGHRVTFVGDEHQAIMGFAGADSESMKRMYQTLAGSSVGCDRLPLTVTRRCGKAIVREAQKYVPGFQAHESNGEGVVKDAVWTWKGTGPDRVLVPWEKTYAPLVQDGAMVVCRTNAPTVSECFRFLARGIKAVVLGRKVGQGLIDLVKKAEKGRDGIGEDAPIAKLIAWLSDWLTAETAKEQAKKYPSEGKIQNLEDKYECLVTFAKSDCARTSEVITRINTVFADKKCPRCGKPYDVDARVCDASACGHVSLVLPGGVKFSSIHKSKGLEAKQVVYLCPPGTGMREDKMQAWELEQEDNLRYVAVTRAISELIYVQ